MKLGLLVRSVVSSEKIPMNSISVISLALCRDFVWFYTYWNLNLIYLYENEISLKYFILVVKMVKTEVIKIKNTRKITTITKMIYIYLVQSLKNLIVLQSCVSGK